MQGYIRSILFRIKMSLFRFEFSIQQQPCSRLKLQFQNDRHNQTESAISESRTFPVCHSELSTFFRCSTKGNFLVEKPFTVSFVRCESSNKYFPTARRLANVGSEKKLFRSWPQQQ